MFLLLTLRIKPRFPDLRIWSPNLEDIKTSINCHKSFYDLYDWTMISGRPMCAIDSLNFQLIRLVNWPECLHSIFPSIGNWGAAASAQLFNFNTQRHRLEVKKATPSWCSTHHPPFLFKFINMTWCHHISSDSFPPIPYHTIPYHFPPPFPRNSVPELEKWTSPAPQATPPFWRKALCWDNMLFVSRGTIYIESVDVNS